jgi:hypothetical protein
MEISDKIITGLIELAKETQIMGEKRNRCSGGDYYKGMAAGLRVAKAIIEGDNSLADKMKQRAEEQEKREAIKVDIPSMNIISVAKRGVAVLKKDPNFSKAWVENPDGSISPATIPPEEMIPEEGIKDIQEFLADKQAVEEAKRRILEENKKIDIKKKKGGEK